MDPNDTTNIPPSPERMAPQWDAPSAVPLAAPSPAPSPAPAPNPQQLSGWQQQAPHVGQQTFPPPTPKVPLSERLPEVAATIGVALISVAVIGFVIATWGQLNAVGRAGVIAGFSVGLTVGGLQLESLGKAFAEKVTALVFMAASVTAAAAVTLAMQALVPDAARVAIAAGGAAAAAHAGWLYLRRENSPARAVTVGLALLYAAGPPGTGANDRYSTFDVDLIPYAMTSLLGSAPHNNIDFLLPGILWMLVGAALLGWSHVQAFAPVRKSLAVFASLTLLGATLMLNAVDNPVGPALALAIIVGFVLYGVMTDSTPMVVVGSGAGIIALFRVAFGIFSGEVAATIVTATLGTALLLYAATVAKKRGSGDVQDGPSETHER